MSRHKKTFAPRANRSEAQNTDNKEEQEKYVPISSQDAKISLAKTEVTQITYAPFQNRAFNKVERGSSIIKFLNNGLHVFALNKALNKLGYNAPEDQIFFGDKTKISLMSFQSDYGIQKSGVFDRETLLKMDEVLGEKFDEEEKYRNESLSNKKTELEKSNKSEPEYHLNSEVADKTLFQSSLKTNKDPIKLKRCNPEHADDYCLIVSFIPTTNIPKGNTIEGYAIYYQAVYGGSEEKAIKVGNLWGENGRIDFSGEIKAGTQTTVNVPLEKYLDNLFFGAPKNESAREALKQKLLGIVKDDVDKKNEKDIDREGLNTFLTDEYSKITEDSEYIKLKNKLKSLSAPELSPEGKKAANLLEKTPENIEAQDILIEEFEKFGKEMTLYMLQINRKLILTEAERHGIWLPYGEHKNKLQELKTDIEVYKTQMATIQANLPSFKEQQKLYKEAYDAVGRDPYATDIHDQKVNQASGIEKKYNARNEIYRSSPILSIGDDFNSKGMKDSKQDWAPDWESFDFKTDEKIIAELKNSIIKQLEKINEAEENIMDEDADFIWDLGKIIPISLQQAGITNNKNAVKVIKNKVREEARDELLLNLVLIAGGIVLSIISLGQATPFLLAVLAGGGALGLSTYFVAKDIHEYKLNQSLYDASMQFGQVLQDDDPTMIMIGLSLLGMLGDATQVIRILKAARATNTVYRSIITLSKAEGLSAKEIETLEKIIDLNTGFKLTFTSDEYIKLAAEADKLGMSSKEFVDFIFTASRIDPKKNINATELLLRMKTWKRLIQPRGYPFKFTNKEAFQDFSKATKDILEKYGIPFSEVRIQGSANVTNNARDIDIAIFVSQKEFDELSEKFVNGIRKNTRNPDAAENMIKDILASKEKGKISSFYFNRLEKSLSFNTDFIDKALKFSESQKVDISLMVRESSFNLEPMIKLDNPIDYIKYVSPVSKTVKGINE